MFWFPKKKKKKAEELGLDVLSVVTLGDHIYYSKWPLSE